MSNSSPPQTIPPLPPVMTQYTQPQVATQSNDESAHDFYVRHENSKALLLCMAVGLTDEEDKPLADWVTDNRFLNYKGKKNWLPTQKILAAERARRKKLAGEIEARKTGMTVSKAKLVDWLVKNPVSCKTDIEFITDEVNTFLLTLENVNAEKTTDQAAVGGNWRGDVPYLRLIHSVLEDDEVRLLYQKSFEIPTREQLDGRHNKDTKKASVWEAAAELWNDKSFEPVSNLYPYLHENYNKDIDISWNEVSDMGVLTARKARDKFTSMQSTLNQIYGRWNASGNGAGTIMHDPNDTTQNKKDDEVNFGGSACKANFLGGRSPVILYLWEYSDRLKVIKTVLQRISDDCALNGGQGPNLIDSGRGKKKCEREEAKKEREEDKKFMGDLKGCMDEQNRNFRQHIIEVVKGKIKDLQMDIYEAKDRRDDLIDSGANEARVDRQLSKIRTLKNLLLGEQIDLGKYLGVNSDGEDDVEEEYEEE